MKTKLFRRIEYGLLKINPLSKIPYKYITRYADWRQRYRWRVGKGGRELSFFTNLKNQAIFYAKRILYLSGLTIGIKLIPPEMLGKLEEWWPGIGDRIARVILWVSAHLTKEVILGLIIGLIVWRILQKMIFYAVGLWFEKSGFQEATQKAGKKRFDWFTMKEIVRPLERIEKKLKSNEKK